MSDRPHLQQQLLDMVRNPGADPLARRLGIGVELTAALTMDGIGATRPAVRQELLDIVLEAFTCRRCRSRYRMGIRRRCIDCNVVLRNVLATVTLSDMTETERSTASRLLATLEALGDADARRRQGLTVAELARALQRDKSAVSRQLGPLVELGLVERTPDGRHHVGWRLFTLAAKAGDERLLLMSTPVMCRLASLTNERVHLSVLHGREVLTILSESSQQMIEAVGWVGRTSPVYCTSSGRALLFDHSDEAVHGLLDAVPFPSLGPKAPKDVDELLVRLREARRQGFAAVAGEFDAELVAVAAPIRDFRGRIIAALNVSAPSFRLARHLTSTGQQVAAAAAHLTSAIASAPVSASQP